MTAGCPSEWSANPAAGKVTWNLPSAPGPGHGQRCPAEGQTKFTAQITALVPAGEYGLFFLPKGPGHRS